MSWIDRMFRGTIQKRVDEQLSSAVDQRLKAALPAAVAERLQAASISLDNDYGWRLLNGTSTRELLIAPYEQQIIWAYYLYKTNPLAAFLIDVPAAFVGTSSLPYQCKNDEVKTLLEAFWKRNRLKTRWKKYQAELGVFGNIVLTAHVAEQTGRVKLGYIDPGLIETTIPDPEDVQTKIGVKIKTTEFHPARTLAVILDRESEEDLSPKAKALREQMTDGQCFLLQQNCMSSELMGTSDLFNVAEHLESYEQTILDGGEKFAQFNPFFYDITVEGADAKKLEEERQLYTPPRTGGAFIHNEKVKATPVAPNLQALDTETASRFQRRHIMGSKSLPAHWYADPEGSNRATADAMDRPTLMKLSDRQDESVEALGVIADFVIRCALDAGYLRVTKDEAYDYSAILPPLSDKDLSKLSTMLRDVSTSLVVAQTNGWINKDDAAKFWAFCAEMIGFEYDPDDPDDLPPEGVDYKNGQDAPGAVSDAPPATDAGAAPEKQP